jgi:hypothetical protein
VDAPAEIEANPGKQSVQVDDPMGETEPTGQTEQMGEFSLEKYPEEHALQLDDPWP